MTETRQIIQAYRRARAEQVRAALATVVCVEGSAYRRAGARMLITETGRTAGVISGGCLDGDVRARAARVMQTRRPVLVKYDTTTDDDLVWGLGLGCNGIVHVLIEPVDDRTDDLMRFLERGLTGHRRVACATVIRSERAEVPLGARVLLEPADTAAIGPGALLDPVVRQILADLETAVRLGVSSVAQYGADAEVEAFIEVVEPRVPLVIVGAGADVIPLVDVAHRLGWYTTVVDTQARGRSVDRFTDADAVILCRPEEVGARVTLTASSVVVVMTHNYLHDCEVLPAMLASPARYVGCLGPRRRTDRLLVELRGDSVSSERLALDRLYAPIGLDVGAETPDEIALSIAAEILAVLSGRSAGSLRHRHGSIHDGTEPCVAALLAGDADEATTSRAVCDSGSA